MTDLTPNDLRLISLVFWAVVIALLCIGVALTQPKRNRRVRRSAWKPGPAHPSFWNNDRRGDVECR